MTEPLPGFRPPDDPHDPTTWRYPESAQVEQESAKAQYAVGGVIFALIAVLVGLLWAAGAFAQPCERRDMWISFMKDKYGLELHSWGLDSEGRMLELLTGEDGRFAVLTTTPTRCTTAVMTDRHHARLGETPFGPGSRGQTMQTPGGTVYIPPPLGRGHPL